MTSGKYANLSSDARGHSSWFLTRTNKEHQATIEHPFMKTLYAQNFDREAYAQYLACQWHIFSKLEEYCTASRHIKPIAALYDKALHRSSALQDDLAVWFGKDWKKKVIIPSPATDAYLKELQDDSLDPWLLLCHHFLQYNAVLSGGQFLGNMVAARAPTLTGCSVGDGTNFYKFDESCQPCHERVQRYLDDFDKLDINESQRGKMLRCMQAVYKLLLDTFDEAYALAPLEGISYAASKDMASKGNQKGSETSPKKKSRIPPPPMEPVDAVIPFEQLLLHDGTSSSRPVLTSVLGRIYDVTAAKEFFGPGAPYEMFAGHDGTYNLAVMSLKKQTLDKFQYNLDDEDKECLSDWIAYFDNRYGRPVGILSGRTHSVKLSDLPAATKIPFETSDSDDDPAEPSKPPQSRL